MFKQLWAWLGKDEPRRLDGGRHDIMGDLTVNREMELGWDWDIEYSADPRAGGVPVRAVVDGEVVTDPATLKALHQHYSVPRLGYDPLADWVPARYDQAARDEAYEAMYGGLA